MWNSQSIMDNFLTILFLLRITLAFEFLAEPLNTTGIEGTITELPCRVLPDQNGVGPMHSYWIRHKDGQWLPLSENADTSIYARSHGSLAGRLSIISDFLFEYRLQISDLQLDDVGYYQCWHLDQKDYSHYARKGYLSVLPRRTEAWFPRCTIDREFSPSVIDITVGSTVVFTCRAPNDIQLPRDVGLYVKDPNDGNSSVTLATCDHVPCSFAYKLKLSDRNSRLICGTRIRSNVFEEECTGSLLPERTMVNLVSRPSILNLNSKGTLYCWAADSRSSYRYQWFIGERNITDLRNDNEFTFLSVRETLNNSKVTCVVNDRQGFVGSRTIPVHVAITTDDEMANSPREEFDYEDEMGNVGTDIPTGEVVKGGASHGNKMFGIPVEVLVFFLCAILVLLLILIIVILLVYRQKTRNIGHADNKHPHVVYQQNTGAKVDINSDVMRASYRPLPPISTQRLDSSEENSLYDNIHEYQQENGHSETLPYNSNNAKSVGVSPNDFKQRSNQSQSSNDNNLGMDYNVLDPHRASSDTLDSTDIEEIHERTRDCSPMRGKSLSVSTNLARSDGSSARSRLASLPVGTQSTLYAVTSLIRYHHHDNLAIDGACNDAKGAPTRRNDFSTQESQSEYASPCNRPKSGDWSLSAGANTGNNGVTNNAATDLTESNPDNGVIVLGKAKDGVEKVVMLDDKKYIMNQEPSGQRVNGRI